MAVMWRRCVQDWRQRDPPGLKRGGVWQEENDVVAAKECTVEVGATWMY
jgi:hypothetical protein